MNLAKVMLVTIDCLSKVRLQFQSVGVLLLSPVLFSDRMKRLSSGEGDPNSALISGRETPGTYLPSLKMATTQRARSDHVTLDASGRLRAPAPCAAAAKR